MADEEEFDGPFGMADDEDDDYEYVVIDPNENGRFHGKWTVITGLLDLASNIAADVSDFFAVMGKVSGQHGMKKIEQREFHEIVTRELESLPVTEEEEDG